MTETLRPDDPRLSWHGAISFERGDGWIKPWRIPFDQRLLFGRIDPPDMMLSRSGMPSGVRIAFRTTSASVSAELEPLSLDAFQVEQAQAARIDIAVDNALLESIPLRDRTHVSAKLPPGDKLVELWLPEYREIRIRSIGLDDGAVTAPYEDARPKWLVYGSSNTQSRGAESPYFTWPAVVARRCDLNLTNIAYGGECHLDGVVARMMRDLPADFIAMEVGINIYINATLNPRALRAAFIGFMQTLRDGHPTTPVVAMSSIYGAYRETEANAAGLTLPVIRAVLAEASADLVGLGDEHLEYVDGLSLFGADMAASLPDDLHPSSEGYKILGNRFAERVMTRYVSGGLQ